MPEHVPEKLNDLSDILTSDKSDVSPRTSSRLLMLERHNRAKRALFEQMQAESFARRTT
ncbi:hypothetical protein [Methylovirgula sp. HY1]|uniref:hypothetical protein n=1 Tax=Methylovirgula sp. HY1 TaxID=2822761 RepID=UPI001C5B58CB|nr:hypothetical protein [Methylovirgula sp. HY1]